MKKREVLLTDEAHPLLIKGLEDLGYAVDYMPQITQETATNCIANYTGLIINSKVKANAELLEKATRLQWIARLGSGLEVINKSICEQKGIKYFNTPEGNRQAVAEHALGMLLNLLNNISKSFFEIKNDQWQREPNRGEELSGKTIAIIGFGNTGEAFARVLSGFDVKLFLYDKYDRKKEWENNYVSMEEIFQKADVVSIHLPLTEETNYYCDNHFFNAFSKPIFFVNTSRGGIVKTAALIQALRNGKVKAAALDVFENEKWNTFTEKQKEEFDCLREAENVILTPHIAGWTVQSKQKIAEVLLKKLKNLI